jgi:hypothetical protein
MDFNNYRVNKSTDGKLIGFEIKDINIDKGVIVLIKNNVEKKMNFDYIQIFLSRVIIRNSNIMIYLIKK